MSWTQDCGTTGFRPDMARCNFIVPLAKKANFVIDQLSMQEKEKIFPVCSGIWVTKLLGSQP